MALIVDYSDDDRHDSSQQHRRLARMDEQRLMPMMQHFGDTRDRLEYELTVRQEPKQARMCGVGADRRPIDPPPIVQLRVIDPQARRAASSPSATSEDYEAYGRGEAGSSGISQSFLQNPYYFMFASLAKPDDDAELHWLKDGKTRCTTGSVVSSLYHLKDAEHNNEDAGFFVFPDLSVRTEGSYRLKLSLFEVVGNNVRHCKSIYSAPFYVYTAKKFPGMEESTPLSCSLADQGIKIRIRKDIRVRKRPIGTVEADGSDDDANPAQSPTSPTSPTSPLTTSPTVTRKKNGGDKADKRKTKKSRTDGGHPHGSVVGLGGLPPWPSGPIDPSLPPAGPVGGGGAAPTPTAMVAPPGPSMTVTDTGRPESPGARGGMTRRDDPARRDDREPRRRGSSIGLELPAPLGPPVHQQPQHQHSQPMQGVRGPGSGSAGSSVSTIGSPTTSTHHLHSQAGGFESRGQYTSHGGYEQAPPQAHMSSHQVLPSSAPVSQPAHSHHPQHLPHQQSLPPSQQQHPPAYQHQPPPVHHAYEPHPHHSGAHHPPPPAATHYQPHPAQPAPHHPQHQVQHTLPPLPPVPHGHVQHHPAHSGPPPSQAAGSYAPYGTVPTWGGPPAPQQQPMQTYDQYGQNMPPPYSSQPTPTSAPPPPSQYSQPQQHAPPHHHAPPMQHHSQNYPAPPPPHQAQAPPPQRYDYAGQQQQQQQIYAQPQQPQGGYGGYYEQPPPPPPSHAPSQTQPQYSPTATSLSGATGPAQHHTRSSPPPPGSAGGGSSGGGGGGYDYAYNRGASPPPPQRTYSYPPPAHQQQSPSPSSVSGGGYAPSSSSQQQPRQYASSGHSYPYSGYSAPAPTESWSNSTPANPQSYSGGTTSASTAPEGWSGNGYARGGDLGGYPASTSVNGGAREGGVIVGAVGGPGDRIRLAPLRPLSHGGGAEATSPSLASALPSGYSRGSTSGSSLYVNDRGADMAGSDVRHIGESLRGGTGKRNPLSIGSIIDGESR